MFSPVVTPGLLQKMSKTCNSPGGISGGLVVFLAVFFRKFEKKSQNVTVYSILPVEIERPFRPSLA